VFVVVHPGEQTNPNMDVDLVIIQRMGKPTVYYFIAGYRNDDSGVGDSWRIDRDGDVQGPPFVTEFGIDGAVVWPATRWKGDIEDAAGRPTPGNMKPQPYKVPPSVGRSDPPVSGSGGGERGLWDPVGSGSSIKYP
jgi:hypothetical protein